MTDQCSKFCILEGKDTKFKHLKTVNSFYETQMRVGKPIYFSPNFHHRLFIDNDTD